MYIASTFFVMLQLYTSIVAEEHFIYLYCSTISIY